MSQPYPHGFTLSLPEEPKLGTVVKFRDGWGKRWHGAPGHWFVLDIDGCVDRGQLTQSWGDILSQASAVIVWDQHPGQQSRLDVEHGQRVTGSSINERIAAER